MPNSIVVLSLLALLGPLAACGGGDGGEEGGATTLTVFAAASLTATFEQIAEEFETTHDGVDVQLNFAGSSDLVAQILEGAPADVFASADAANMRKLSVGDLAGAEPADFASNTLQIAVPRGNPSGVDTFDDLAAENLNLVVCAPEVPCGAAAEAVADAAGVELSPVSEEQSVIDVLAKVVSGEADAGLVYVTDVIAAGDTVDGIAFPESEAAVNVYPIAPVLGSELPDLAQEFVDLVLSDSGQSLLGAAGFGTP